MKVDLTNADGRDVCPMCGQPLADESAAKHVAEYEKRAEARLRKKLTARAMAAAEEKYAGLLAQAKQETDDLRRKLEGKSARSLGEEQQVALLARLTKAFPDDDLAPIADNGAGDIMQTVRSRGREVGSILHECKNTKQWLNTWIAKIKQDGETRRATHLVITSRRLPRRAQGYCERDGVLICRPEYVEALTHVLRMWMIATYVEGDDAPDERKLWTYLDGDQFHQRLETLRSATSEENDALVAEERAHKRWWDARAGRVGTMRNAVAGIEGDIQEIVKAPHERTQHPKRNASAVGIPS